MKTRKMLKKLLDRFRKENPTMSDVHVIAGGGYGVGRAKRKPRKTAPKYAEDLAKRSEAEQAEDEIILQSLESEKAVHAHRFQKAQHRWPEATSDRCLTCGLDGAADTFCQPGLHAARAHLPEMYRHWIGLEKAVWDAATVNDLPDSAFAVILPGGTKDSEDKTTPRSLRKLPYKGVGGSVDLPHLRDALSRLPQTDLPPDVRAQARRTLEGAASHAGVGKSDDEDGLQILKTSDQQKLWLIVSEPGEEDTQGDVISADDIEKAAHHFLVRYRKGETRLRLQHAADLVDEQATLIEHYLAPVDFTVGGQAVKKGSWIQGWQIPDAEIWKAVKAGDFTGASLGGTGVKVPIEDVPAPKAAKMKAAAASPVTVNLHMGGGRKEIKYDAAGRPVALETEDPIAAAIAAQGSTGGH